MPPLSPFNRTCLALAIGQVMTIPVSGAATIPVNSSTDTSTADGFCTLREAIISANTNSNAHEAACIKGDPGLDTLTFNPVTFPSGSLTNIKLSSVLDITEDLIINGPGKERLGVSGNKATRVFYIDSATVSMNSLTISDGNVVGDTIPLRWCGNIFNG